MKVLSKIKITDMLFLDIETVRLVEELKVDTDLFDSWAYKMKYEMPNASNDELIEAFKKKAALHAEFSRIACISLGYVNKLSRLNIKSYKQDDEKELLQEFMSDLEAFTNNNKDACLAGHFIIYFDIPFIMKRSIINQVVPHDLVDTSGDKPWDITTIDTKDIWKGTSPAGSSLINIAVALGMPSPKDDIAGDKVGDVYYGELEGGIDRIVTYCEKDVLTTANIVRKFKFEPLLEIQKQDESAPTTSIVQTLFNGGKYTATHKKKLVEAISKMNGDEKDKAYEILKAMISKAKGTVTKFTTEHLNEIKELCK